MSNLSLQLRGYRLTTAEIIYRLPDHPGVLQSFVWQNLDLAPHFPVLHRFLDFWERNIEGKLHSVKVASTGIIHPGELRHPGISLALH
ncbi:MAG TPA: usg protein [Stellaceae bacterium]|nr:usg protein [Stellaceae bacterium]